MQNQNGRTTAKGGPATGSVTCLEAETIRQGEELLHKARVVARTIDERVRHLLNNEKGGAFLGPGESSGLSSPSLAGGEFS